jgi:sulfide:quinone oxidoreductase
MAMPARIVVLGGGVGGTLAANLLARTLRTDARVTVVDPTGMHVYQPGFLYVALGQANSRWLARQERSLLRRDIALEQEGARLVDPSEQVVHLEDGSSMPYDYLVLASGARLVPEEVPGMVDAAHEFYSLAGAERLRDALWHFKGGRILVGVAGIPYKCPPAPVEFVFMVEEFLRHRRIRDKSEVTLLSPLNRAFTIESASKVVQPIMESRGIGLTTFFNVETVDPSNRAVISMEGETAQYDLLVLVPPHRGQRFIEESGLGDPRGWVPADRTTLQHQQHERIFALGDATNLPISKSGSTAHFEAPVVASRIASLVRGTAPRAAYGGRVMCFLETGGRKATALRFDYEHPPTPPQPSRLWHSAKWLFNRIYWVTVPQGRVPEFHSHPGRHAPKERAEERSAA